MRYKEFREAYEAQREKMRAFDGGRDFPGLGRYDRVYALPCESGTLVAIVRALAQHRGTPAAIELHFKPRTHYMHEIKSWNELDDAQVRALLEIRRQVAAWLEGELDALPPSTSSFWSRAGES